MDIEDLVLIFNAFCSPLCSVNARRVKLHCRAFIVENDHGTESMEELWPLHELFLIQYSFWLECRWC